MSIGTKPKLNHHDPNKAVEPSNIKSEVEQADSHDVWVGAPATLHDLSQAGSLGLSAQVIASIKASIARETEKWQKRFRWL